MGPNTKATSRVWAPATETDQEPRGGPNPKAKSREWAPAPETAQEPRVDPKPKARDGPAWVLLRSDLGPTLAAAHKSRCKGTRRILHMGVT